MTIQDIKKLADGTILVNKKLKNATFKKKADGLHCLVNDYLYFWTDVNGMADGWVKPSADGGKNYDS